jgi:hypothetical protein
MNTDDKHQGYAILIVLIAVAIMLMLAAVQMRVLFVGSGPKPSTGIEQRPWLLEELLAGDDEAVKLPRPPKPQFAEILDVTGRVTRETSERGTVSIHFETNGRIRAAWNTEYRHAEQTIALSAEMTGNIQVGQTYEGPDGKDKSRLFFIARGPYVKQTFDPAFPVRDERGTTWLIGWLHSDRRAEGHLTLTTDRTWSTVYDWTASPSGEN